MKRILKVYDPKVNILKELTMKTIQGDKVYTEEVIISTKARRGLGVKRDPIRVITEIFQKDGEKIAEFDPCASEITFVEGDLVDFARWIRSEGITPIERSDVDLWLESIENPKP